MTTELVRFKEIMDNTRAAVQRRVASVPTPVSSAPAETLERACGGLSRGYYKLGLLAYLVDGDIGELFADLYRAARTYECLLRRYAANADGFDRSAVMASNTIGLDCAMAIGEFELARRISSLQPRDLVPSYDPPDLYAYTQALRALLEREAGDVERLLGAFDQARGAEREGAALAFRAIAEKDGAAFAKAIEVFQDEWKQAVLDGSYTDMPGGARPGEEVICLRAMSLVRLAAEHGLPTSAEYSMVPRELLAYSEFKPPGDGYPVLE